MTAIYNVKSRKCAFCKYWYDPTNSNISPKSPNMGFWQILDTTKKTTCLKKNLQVSACATCPKFECKL